MATTIRHFGSADPTVAFPTIERRSIAVNTANRQIAVGDENGAAVGVPLALIAVRYFDTRAKYAAGDMVIQAGALCRAKAVINPGAFSAAQWDIVTGGAADQYLLLDGTRPMTGALVLPGNPTLPLQATPKQYIDAVILNKVDRAGDTMTGPLVLSGDPVAALGAATKQYAVARAGDTMTGPLVLPGNPTLALQAAPMQYADLKIARAGDTMGGHLSLPTGPAAANAVRKDYVDGLLSTLAVRYDIAQSATASQQEQARKNIAAAPFDVMAYSGLQLNGSGFINQALGHDNPVSSGYFCDQWLVYATGAVVACRTAAIGANQYGLSHYIQAAVTTAQPALGSTDQILLYQTIEGTRAARVGFGGANAQPLTVGFFSAHHRPGDYTVAIMNLANTRGTVLKYTQNVADTWEWHTVTVSTGCPDGAWPQDNTGCIALQFVLAAGSSLVAPAAGVWSSTIYKTLAGCVNGVGSASDVFRISGVILLPGNEAPIVSRAQLVTRALDQELLACMRYYEHAYAPGTLPGSLIAAAGSGTVTAATAKAIMMQSVALGNRGSSRISFVVPKRAAPTLTYWCWGGTPSAFTTFDANGVGSVNGQTGDTFRGVAGDANGLVATNGPSSPYWFSSCMWAAAARV